MMLVGTCAITLNPGPGPCTMSGSANPPTLVGAPIAPFALLVKITSSGPLGTAEYSWSTNGGADWSPSAKTQNPNVTVHSEPPTMLEGQVFSLGTTGRENPVGEGLGLNARFVDTTFAEGDQWSFALATLGGTPTPSGTGLALAIGAADIVTEWARLLEEKQGCPLPDPDDDNTGAIDGWLAIAQRRFDALATRAAGLGLAIVGHLTSNAVPLVGGVEGTLS